MDSKDCHGADERAQDGKTNVLVRVRECNPSNVDGMERARSQSLARGQIRPDEARKYDPGNKQSDGHLD